jgi:hypothetical protein
MMGSAFLAGCYVGLIKVKWKMCCKENLKTVVPVPNK